MVGPDAAEDVMQDAMIDAYRGLAGFAGHAEVGTWLYRIALNRCLQERRRTKPLVVAAEPLELLGPMGGPDYRVDPALAAARRSHAKTLQSVLGQLPEGCALEEHLESVHRCTPRWWTPWPSSRPYDVSGVDQLVRRVLDALAEPLGPDDPLQRPSSDVR